METQLTTSFNAQESFNTLLAGKEPLEIVTALIKDGNPPLWNLFEHGAFQMFGVNEIVIRGLSFFFYLVALFFIYKIGSHFFSRKTGVLSILLTFSNPFLFRYALEGQGYSLLAGTVCASMYFFLKILRGEGHPKILTQIGYVVSTLGALYTHPFALFVLFVQGLWFLSEFVFGKKEVVGALLKLFGAVVVFSIPSMFFLYRHMQLGGAEIPTPGDLKIRIWEYLAKGTGQLYFTIPYFNLSLDSLALYCMAGIFVLRKWHKGIQKSAFLLSWFFIPILITWGVSRTITPIFDATNLLYVIPGAMILLGSNTRKLSYIPIAATLLFFAIIDVHYFIHPTKPALRELASYINAEQIPTDAFLNWDSQTSHLWETKYYGVTAPIYRLNNESSSLPPIITPEDVLYELPDAPRIGIITSGPVEEVALPEYKMIEEKEFRGVKVLWFEKEE